MKNQNGALIKKFNKGLEKLRKNGTYDFLLSEWQLTSPQGSVNQ
jgi:ABC-type amino acid transport substrate-binding protein